MTEEGCWDTVGSFPLGSEISGRQEAPQGDLEMRDGGDCDGGHLEESS